jgi:hypothetical protein
LSGSALTYEALSYGSQDSNLENVSLPGKALRDYAHKVAEGLGDFGTGPQINDAKIYGALNYAMANNGVSSWCDRCRVLGLHSPKRTADNDIGAVFSACVTDTDVKNALGGTPPEPNGRIDAATCSACPAGQYSDNNGVCQVCTGVLVGNSCQTCSVDLVLDGSTMTIGSAESYSTNSTASGDTCPGLFVVELDDPGLLPGRGANTLDVLTAGAVWGLGASQADCVQTFELDLAHMSGSALIVDTVLTGTGVWSGGGGVTLCTGYPIKSWSTPTFAPGAKLFFAAPASATQKIWVYASTPIVPT